MAYDFDRSSHIEKEVALMAGLLLGAVCGAVELYLLNLLVSRVTGGGEVPFWVIPAKMTALALFFVPVALFFKDQLMNAGIAAAVVLMAGSIILFLQKKRRHGGEAG